MEERAYLDLHQLEQGHWWYRGTQGTARNLPFRDGSFSLVAALGVLEHIADDADARVVDSHAALRSPWRARDGFQLGPPRTERRAVMVDGERTVVDIDWRVDGAHVHAGSTGDVGSTSPSFVSEYRAGPGRLLVIADGTQTEIALPTWDASAVDEGDAGDSIRAPINGKVARLFVAEGDAIEKGGRVAVVEAMKMEHVLHAAHSGRIARLAVREGQQVTQGTVIAALETA